MKKYFLPLLILTALLSGCGSEETATEDKAAEFRKAYAHGFDEGVDAFRHKFDEEIRPAYNWLAEATSFYANTVCILSDNKTYHAYGGCWDIPEEPYDMMFISDAEAYGYKRCSSCFGETNEMEIESLPDYDYFVRHYEPEYSEFVESEFVD